MSKSGIIAKVYCRQIIINLLWTPFQLVKLLEIEVEVLVCIVPDGGGI